MKRAIMSNPEPNSNNPIVPDIVANTPAVAPTPEPERVSFTPEQQAKVDQIVREAHGRLARDLREQLAKEKAEKARIEAELEIARAAASPDATALEKAQYETQQERQRREAAEQALVRRDREDAIRAAARTAGFVSETQALKLVDVPEGATPAEIEKLVSDYGAANPNLIKGQVRPGSGSTPASGLPAPTVPLEKLFGRDSDARLANALAIKNPVEYKRMRAVAKAKGIL
jgi:hypothetical protein